MIESRRPVRRQADGRRPSFSMSTTPPERPCHARRMHRARTSAGTRPLLVGALVVVPCSRCARRRPHAPRSPALERTVDASRQARATTSSPTRTARWLEATRDPAGQGAVGRSRRDQRADAPAHRAAARRRAHRAAGSSARKVADFRAAWLNEAAIEARGRAPLQSQLDSIDAHRATRRRSTRCSAAGMRADVDPLNWGVYQSSQPAGPVGGAEHSRREDVRRVPAAGRARPPRPRAVRRAPSRACRRSARRYQSVHRQSARRSPAFDRADQRADAVLALETAIAQTHATREASANDHNADNRVDARRLRAPRAGHGLVARSSPRPDLGRQDSFVAWQPTAITGVAALDRVAAARGVEGLSALSPRRRLRRRAAARVRRARDGAARGDDGQPQPALARATRARRDASRR